MELQTDRQLTWLDHVRLFKLVRTASGLDLAAETVEQAKEVLEFAEVVDPHRFDGAVVTMRSRARLELPRGTVLEVRLSYPDEVNPGEGCISVFSPLVLSLLGVRLGERVHWVGPNGEDHGGKVTEILYQPEAAGDFSS
jgi:regulator of nucleoside diphosphate kinase